jgi:hypothetical protein
MKDKHLVLTTFAGIAFIFALGAFTGWKASEAKHKAEEKGYVLSEGMLMKPDNGSIKPANSKDVDLDSLYMLTEISDSIITLKGYVNGLNTSQYNELDTIYYADIDSLDKNGMYLYYRIVFVGSGEDVAYLHFNFEADSVYRSDSIIN